MKRSSSVVLALVLSLSIVVPLSAAPIAMRVEVSPQSVSDTGTVMAIQITLAPDDYDRVGRWPRLRIKLLDGKRLRDHILEDVDFDADGRIQVTHEWPPGSHELQLTIEDSRGNVLGLWAGRIDIPASLEPAAAIPAPVPRPKPTAPPQQADTPEPTEPPIPAPKPKPTGPPDAEPGGELPPPAEMTPAPEAQSPPESAAPAVPADTSAPAAPEPSATESIGSATPPPPHPAEPPEAEQTADATPVTDRSAAPAEEPPAAEPIPEQSEAAPAETPTEAAAVPYVVRSADQPAAAPVAAEPTSATEPEAEPASPPPPEVTSPFTLVLDVDPGDPDLINRAAHLRDDIERRAGESPRTVIPAGEDGPAPAIAQAVTTIGVDTRAIVVISDGRTKSSRSAWKTATEAANLVRIPIVILGLYNKDFDPATRNRFSELGGDTGGGSFVLQPAESPTRAMAVLEDAFARSREP